MSPQVVAAGQSATVTVSGFPARSPVVMELFSDPVVLGSVVTDDAGSFVAVVAVPPATEPGVHTLVVTGPGGTPRADAPLTVSRAAIVPGIVNLVSGLIVPASGPVTVVRTGSDTAQAARVALLLVALGAVLVGWPGGRAPSPPASRPAGTAGAERYRSDRQVTGGPAATVDHDAPASSEA